MTRVTLSLVALASLLAQGGSIQDGPQSSSPGVDIKPVSIPGVSCSISISAPQSEHTDDGSMLRFTLKNASDFDASVVELHFFVFSPHGGFSRASSRYVDILDLPVPAHGTKDTSVLSPSLKDGEHLRVGAVLGGEDDCGAARLKKAALAEFEPPDFLIVKAEGTPFTVTAARPVTDAAGAPLRVLYTVEDSAPNYAADNARVAVIAFQYTERLGAFTVGLDLLRDFRFGHSVSSAVNLNLSGLPDKGKWKLAIMPVSGLFDGHQWTVCCAKTGAIASDALYGSSTPSVRRKTRTIPRGILKASTGRPCRRSRS